MAEENGEPILAQIAAERERLRDLGDTIFDHVRDLRRAGVSLEALDATMVLHGHVVAAITALSRALGSEESAADA